MVGPVATASSGGPPGWRVRSSLAIRSLWMMAIPRGLVGLAAPVSPAISDLS
jgi:hypothetical protein